MKPYRLFLLVIPLFLAACGLSPQEKADYARVENSGVSPAIYDKMVHDDDLSVTDIEALSRAHVNSGIILRYLRDHDTVYFLHSADVSGLQRAGVDPSVVDYMLQSGRSGYGPGYGYGYPYGPYGYGYGYDPFWYPGFYFGGGYYYGNRDYGHRGYHHRY